MAKRNIPEVNAGSMADIAFLLLIFFLVTTTIETDSGLDRKLPPIEPPEDEVVIKQKNILEVIVNKNNQIFADDEVVKLDELKDVAVAFLDNGGGTGDEACSFCQGKRDPSSSDNPDKAVISLKNDRETKYSTYIAVQNELVAAYNVLRDRECQRLYGRPFTDMEAEYKDPKTPQSVKDDLKPKIENIKKMIPQKLSEAEAKSN
jgi:biopolymer transport protein ExbD